MFVSVFIGDDLGVQINKLKKKKKLFFLLLPLLPDMLQCDKRLIFLERVTFDHGWDHSQHCLDHQQTQIGVPPLIAEILQCFYLYTIPYLEFRRIKMSFKMDNPYVMIMVRLVLPPTELLILIHIQQRTCRVYQNNILTNKDVDKGVLLLLMKIERMDWAYGALMVRFLHH